MTDVSKFGLGAYSPDDAFQSADKAIFVSEIGGEGNKGQNTSSMNSSRNLNLWFVIRININHFPSYLVEGEAPRPNGFSPNEDCPGMTQAG